MLVRNLKFILLAALAAYAACTPSAMAVSCTVSAAMGAPEREQLQTAAMRIGTAVAQGELATVRSDAGPSLAADFSGITSVINDLAPLLKGASVTVEAVYALHAADLAAGGDAQFFCSRSDSPLLVTITLGQIPAGEYALAVVHATGVSNPQQMALVLQGGSAPRWQLAGFSARPLTFGGHSELWFWKQARAAKSSGAPVSAFLDYQAAFNLARPADLYTSNNLDKLNSELTEVRPQELSDSSGLTLPISGGTPSSVTGLRLDTGLGAMDVRVDATVPTLGDAVASRSTTLALMTALLAKYPELRNGFHGLWVFATAANGQTYSLEQPMAAIR